MIDYTLLPGHMRGAMQRYVEDKLPPGSFLEAVLANDLCGACMRADSTNIGCLQDYAAWLKFHAPRQLWGSYQKVDDWINSRLSPANEN